MCIEQGFMNNTSNSCFQVIGNKNSISNRKDCISLLENFWKTQIKIKLFCLWYFGDTTTGKQEYEIEVHGCSSLRL